MIMDENSFIQFGKLVIQNRLSPLFVAANHGLPYCIYFLLTKCDVDVNEICCRGTPLNCAIARNHVKVVKLLLSHPRIRLNRQNKLIKRPLHEAIDCSDVIMFPLLLKQTRIDVNDTDNYGNNCFMYACLRGDISALETLWNINVKTKVNFYQKHEKTNHTASHIACTTGNVPVVEFLLKHGLFQANAVDCKDDTPLGSACRMGQLNIVHLLLQDQVYTNVPEQCFLHASGFGYVQVMNILLRYTPKDSALKFIQNAVAQNNIQVVILLVNELDQIDK